MATGTTLPSSSTANATKERFLQAVNLILRDQEQKYDECLVDRLFQFVAQGRGISLTTAEAIKSWYGDKELVNANHARLFKLQDHYYRFMHSFSRPLEIDLNTPAECFWSRIPAVVTRNNPSEVSAALGLLGTMLRDKPMYVWVIEKQFTDFFIVDVVNLAKYYLETNKNYHIQNQAKTLFVELIKWSWRLFTPNQHRFVLSMKQSIEQLIEAGSPAMYHVLFDCLRRRMSNREFLDKYDLKPLFRKVFNESLEKKDSRDINNICKCLALSGIHNKTMIDKLKSTGNLQAIITYVTNFYDNIFYHTTMRHFVVYPILVHCDSEDARVLASQLMLTRDNETFVERFTEEKFLTPCIMYLKLSVSRKNHDLTAAVASRNHRRYFIYYLEVVLEYVKCNFKSSKAYKNVMECCKILSEGIDRLFQKNMIVWLFQLIDDICELTKTNDDSISGQDKAIFLEMIKLLAKSQHKTTVFRSRKFMDKIHMNYVRYIRMAERFSDLDILNEWACLFNRCDFNFEKDSDNSRLYVELVWKHMFDKAKDNAFHDLYGNIVSLFCYIDIHCDEKLLADLEIQKYHTIPRQMGDILANPSSDYTTIEAILKSISNHYSGEPKLHSINYLLYVIRSTKSCSDDLEYLVESICISLKRELDEFTYPPILRSMFNLVEELLKINRNSADILAPLIKTRILETFHYIHESSLFSRETRTHVCRKLHRLKSALPLRSIYESQQAASESFVNLAKKLDPNDITRHERVSEVAEFYYTRDRGMCPLSEPDCKAFWAIIVDINSYIDTILEQQTSSRGVLECY